MYAYHCIPLYLCMIDNHVHKLSHIYFGSQRVTGDVSFSSGGLWGRQWLPHDSDVSWSQEKWLDLKFGPKLNEFRDTALFWSSCLRLESHDNKDNFPEEEMGLWFLQLRAGSWVPNQLRGQPESVFQLPYSPWKCEPRFGDQIAFQSIGPELRNLGGFVTGHTFLRLAETEPGSLS